MLDIAPAQPHLFLFPRLPVVSNYTTPRCSLGPQEGYRVCPARRRDTWVAVAHAKKAGGRGTTARHRRLDECFSASLRRMGWRIPSVLGAGWSSVPRRGGTCGPS